MLDRYIDFVLGLVAALALTLLVAPFLVLAAKALRAVWVALMGG